MALEEAGAFAPLDHRLEDAALHLLVDEDVDKQDQGRPRTDEEAQSGGRIPGNLLASIVFPKPGGPLKSKC